MNRYEDSQKQLIGKTDSNIDETVWLKAISELSSAPDSNISAALKLSTSKNASRAKETEVSPEIAEMVTNLAASNKFETEIESAVSTIPTPILKRLEHFNTKIFVSQNASDILTPEQTQEHPQGYAPGSTRKDSPALVIREGDKSRIGLSEKALGDKRDQRSAVSHEVGHVIGDNEKVHNDGWLKIGFIEFGGHESTLSDSDEFKKAYESDVAKLTDEQKKLISYYLQPGDDGRHESFAELFNYNIQKWSASDLQKLLPQSSAVVQKYITNLT